MILFSVLTGKFFWNERLIDVLLLNSLYVSLVAKYSCPHRTAAHMDLVFCLASTLYLAHHPNYCLLIT